LPCTSTDPPLLNAAANLSESGLASNHYLPTYPCCRNCPTNSSNSPSGFALAMHGAGMMTTVLMAVKAPSDAEEEK
jgi:hypothetical protein